MFLRFVTTRIDEASRKPQGLFQVIYSLLKSGDLSSEEWERAREILDWFERELPAPSGKFDAPRAIFWFRSGAEESIKQIWDLVYLVREHGYHVEVHKCRKLVNICYSDRLQIAAYPSEHDARITIQ